MSPLDRLDWLRALSTVDAPTCAWRVAAVLAVHVNSESGRSWPGLRNALGINTAKRGARWLVSEGWAEVVESIPGKPIVYRLTRVNADPGSALIRGQSCTPTRVNAEPPPGSILTPTRVSADPRTREEPGNEPGSEPGSALATETMSIGGKHKNGSKTFLKPTVDEVQAYCEERGNRIEPERFFDHYEANGWKVGKSAMKDWRATIRNWERRQNDNSPIVSDVRNVTHDIPPEMSDYIG